jgi:hypothetical protein
LVGDSRLDKEHSSADDDGGPENGFDPKSERHFPISTFFLFKKTKVGSQVGFHLNSRYPNPFL